MSLVAEDEPGLASKAAYLAAVIAGGNSKEVVALAAQSRHDVVRVAAAAAAALLPAEEAVEITSSLLQDTDARVRVRAVKSSATINSPILIERLEAMAVQDPVRHVRDFAAGVAREMRAKPGLRGRVAGLGVGDRNYPRARPELAAAPTVA